MLRPYLQILMGKASLTPQEAESAMDIILDETEPHQTAAFLTLLKLKGETADEVIGTIKALQKRAVSVPFSIPTIDIVGTGGDLANTVNISTGSAVLAAACELPVAKHGNRSASSQCGSADVLEALNINIQTPPEALAEQLRQIGVAYMFAPMYHPALKKLAPIRKGLKIPTLFNLLGPLLNPAKAPYALMGVTQENLLPLMSQVIVKQGHMKRSLLFHGSGLDELSTLGKITAYDIHEGNVQPLEILPEDLGFTRCSLSELQGGAPDLNALLLKQAFAGESGAIADALIFNAGAALWIYGKTPTLNAGVQEARKVQKSGKALDVLNKWVAFSNKTQKDQTS